LVLILIKVVKIIHSCVAVHAILSTSADVRVVKKHTLRESQWTNCCRDSDAIVVSLTEAGGQSATRACTGVLMTNTGAVITHAQVIVFVLIFQVVEIINSCIAVHVVLSTRADVCVVIKHTAISWSNCSIESNDITVSLTEAGGQSATRAGTGVLITSAVTIITPALVLVLFWVSISLVVETMHTCVAVHAVLSTSADVRVVIKPTVIDWSNCCRDSDAIVVICTEAGR